MSKNMVAFVRDQTGFDKLLRGIQSVAIVASTFSGSSPRWTTTKIQLDYVRRFPRALSWLDCWSLCRSGPTTANDDDIDDEDYLGNLLFTTKWSLMGLYLFLEMFTLPYAMTILSREDHSVTIPIVKIEMQAFTAYLYALFASIAWDAHRLRLRLRRFSPSSTSSAMTKSEKKETKKQDSAGPTGLQLLRSLVTDLLDVLVPLGVLGWIDLGERTVGSVLVVTSALQAWEVYEGLAATAVA